MHKSPLSFLHQENQDIRRFFFLTRSRTTFKNPAPQENQDPRRKSHCALRIWFSWGAGLEKRNDWYLVSQDLGQPPGGSPALGPRPAKIWIDPERFFVRRRALLRPPSGSTSQVFCSTSKGFAAESGLIPKVFCSTSSGFLFDVEWFFVRRRVVFGAGARKNELR